MSHALKSSPRTRDSRPSTPVQYKISSTGVASASASEVLSKPQVQAQLKAVAMIRESFAQIKK